MTTTSSGDQRQDNDVRLDALEAHLARLDAELQDVAALLVADIDAEGDGHAATSQKTDDGSPQPAFATLEEWVEQYYLTVFTRPTGGSHRWCTQWRDHPEAVTRLEALWRSWETLRLDPNLGIATWLTNYLDPQLNALTTPTGTFHSCTSTRHADSGGKG